MLMKETFVNVIADDAVACVTWITRARVAARRVRTSRRTIAQAIYRCALVAVNARHTVPLVTSPTGATETTNGVGAKRISVAVVSPQSTLVLVVAR